MTRHRRKGKKRTSAPVDSDAERIEREIRRTLTDRCDDLVNGTVERDPRGVTP